MAIRSTLLLLACLFSLAINADAEDSKPIFEPPKLILADSQPLNNDCMILYPSPAMMDIDNDGKKELVLGSIFGGLFVCEDKSTQTNTHEWSKPEPLQSKDGQTIRLNNW